MDEDGLIPGRRGPGPGDLDGCEGGDIPPTPRHGKPVEINAYWYNALRIMERFCELAAQQGPRLWGACREGESRILR